jgi:hypothetical protein
MKRLIALTTATGVALAGSALVAPAAFAKDGDMKKRGDCTASSDYAVKVKQKKGQLRADFWVKNNAPAGASWTLDVTRDSATLVTSTKATVTNDDDDDDDSMHTAEAKWRTWASTTGGAMTFTASGPNGEKCEVTVP